MSTWRQTWLVARRELRERSRSRAFRASLVLMIFVVVGAIVVPALLDDKGAIKKIGLVGDHPSRLATAIEAQGRATNLPTDVIGYSDIEAGRDAVRDGNVNVLVVNGHQLEWQGRIDSELRTMTVATIQSLSIRERALRTGMSPDTLSRVIAPVKITDLELGQVAGRSPDDETATFIMTILLFMALTTYGTMVLSGVVEEKSSRVVEVLLARMPARNLLAGKVAGIGLLGFGQFALTALAALITVSFVDSFDIPAVRGPVLVWLVIWFALGYAFYATAFGALGSLASRTEDTQSVAGPITLLMMLAYFISFAVIGSPDARWAKVVSFLPPTAPLAMPARMAMSDLAWWEPVVAAGLTVGAIVALVRIGGRVYTNAILHGGPTLKLSDAWRGGVSRGALRWAATERSNDQRPSERKQRMEASHRRVTLTAVIVAGVVIGVGAALLMNDVILGIAIGAGFIAIATRIIQIWSPPILKGARPD
jgi:ABC-2 type transport system permease protein